MELGVVGALSKPFSLASAFVSTVGCGTTSRAKARTLSEQRARIGTNILMRLAPEGEVLRLSPLSSTKRKQMLVGWSGSLPSDNISAFIKKVEQDA
jgi:hypothetical protein